MKSYLLFLWLVIVSFSSLSLAQPVYIPDQNLKAAIEAVLGPDPNATDMLGLTLLDARNKGIADLTGLEYALNLESLDLRHNNISNVSELSGLINLDFLLISGNNISNISELSGLTNLGTLGLGVNHISNISALSVLTKLEFLDLALNNISNISSLSGLTNLQYLFLDHNPLDCDAYRIYIPEIDNNNNFKYSYRFFYDRRNFVCPPDVSTYSAINIAATSATLRASLVDDDGDPTECRFSYWIEGQQIQTEQTTAWQPVAKDAIFTELVSNLLPNTMYSYKAEARNSGGLDINDYLRSFTTLAPGPNSPPAPKTLYVDVSAPFDPNAEGNGTENQPFDSIQEAIDAANPYNTTILVAPGRYFETLDLHGKNIHLKGLVRGVTDRGNAVLPIIDANDQGTVVTFDDAEDANCMLTYFVLTGGFGEFAGAVSCMGSSPVFDHCLIVGNRFTSYIGGVVYLEDSNSVFVNCTLADNVGLTGGAVITYLHSNPIIRNSIIWNNIPTGILVLDQFPVPDISYSTITGGGLGLTNLGDDPLFVSPGLWVQEKDPNVPADPTDPDAIWLDGDYHLMSESGRWNPLTNTWVVDNVTSPAIDAGDPLSDWSIEPVSNGERINQGVYGGTYQASKSKD